MSEPVKKPNQHPENYSPKKPVILNMAEAKTDNRTFTSVKGKTFSYRYDLLELNESLKFACCVNNGKRHSEIILWHDYDKSLIPDLIKPSIEINLWQNETHKEGKWSFGGLVHKIDTLPDDVFGVDTGWKRFVVLTIRCATVHDVTRGNHFHWAHWKSGDFMPSEFKNMEFSPIAPGADKGFSTKNGGSTSIVEIYPAEIAEGIPEMCFYFPLKD